MTEQAVTETSPGRDKGWGTQVYGPDGEWVGFFQDDATAKKWIGRKKGYEITDRLPERSTVEVKEAAGAAEAETHETLVEEERVEA